MRLSRTSWAIVLGATAAGAVWAQAEVPAAPAKGPDAANRQPRRQAPKPDEAGGKLDRVEIKARRDEVDERRVSAAAKIVVGREEIEQYDDATLADVLKRLPSVTIGGRPGRGGQIRMRGMGNGYTQILIDGERSPPGFAIDQISPEQVERIEIYRAPTAETGSRAIAGTINIVLREPLRQRGDDLRAGIGEERGRLQPNVSWTRNDVLGERGTYNLTLSANRADLLTDTSTRTIYQNVSTGQTELAQNQSSRQHSVRDSVHLTSRIQWQLGQGDQFSVQPFVVLSRGHSRTSGALEQLAGPAPAPYATSLSAGSSGSALGRLMFQLRKRLGEDTRLELRGNIGAFHSSSDSTLDEFSDSSVPVLDQRTSHHQRPLLEHDGQAVASAGRQAPAWWQAWKPKVSIVPRTA